MTATMKNSLIAAGLSFLAFSAQIVEIFVAAQSHAEANAGDIARLEIATSSVPGHADADTTGDTSTLYKCGAGVDIRAYHYDSDDSHIFIAWESRIYRLEKIATTTGALRFENEAAGLVWIAIPTKGILLDSKSHRQLANECKNALEAESILNRDVVAGVPTPSPPIQGEVPAPRAVGRNTR